MLKAIALTVFAAVATPALAASATPTATPTAQAQPNPLDKVVCKTEDSLGSRLNAKRVCLTVREWQEQQEANRAALEKMQQQGQTNPTGN